MSLEAFELVGNANVEVDGEKGHVVSTNSGLTSVAYDGKVSWYTTDYILENASIVEPPKEQDQPAPTVAGSATIGTAPVTEPVADPAVPGPAVDPVNEPPTATGPAATSLGDNVNTQSQAESDVAIDAQIAEAQAKLAELEAQKSASGSRSQS